MKKGFKKVLMVTSLVVLVFGFTACGIKNIFSEVSLEEASRVMTEELDNCDYKMNVAAMGFSVESTGSIDIKNDITYSTTSFFGMSTSEYIDNGSGYKYSNDNSLFSFGEDTDDSEEVKWVKSLITEDDTSGSEILSFVDISEYLTGFDVEDEDGGKRYSGVVSSEDIEEFASENEEMLEDEEEIVGNVEIEFFVNSDNYIESIEMVYEAEGSEMKISIEFSSFNTAGDIVIPDEALNAELEEEDEWFSY